MYTDTQSIFVHFLEFISPKYIIQYVSDLNKYRL